MGTLHVPGALSSAQFLKTTTARWQKRTSNAEQTLLNSPSDNRLSMMLSSELRLRLPRLLLRLLTA